MKKLNIADWLSVYRMVAVPVLVVVMVLNLRLFFAYLILISLASDMIDGFIARKLGIASSRGAQFDSVGDALTFVIATMGIWRFEQVFVEEHLAWILLAFIPYVLQILIAIVVYGKPSSFHTYLAKTAALFQGLCMLLILFHEPAAWLFYLTVFITVLEVMEEVVLVFLLPEWKTDVKGIYWVLKDRKKKKTLMPSGKISANPLILCS